MNEMNEMNAEEARIKADEINKIKRNTNPIRNEYFKELKNLVDIYIKNSLKYGRYDADIGFIDISELINGYLHRQYTDELIEYYKKLGFQVSTILHRHSYTIKISWK